jgi:carbonic anhydrase
MLPAERHYYRFTGSLTTPPCSEGVRWLVVQKPVTASKAQIDAFTKAVGFPNNRPLQALNARQVLSQ